VVSKLNVRYSNGSATDELRYSGVLIHQWDDLEDINARWQPCSIPENTCQFKDPYDDRVSCSVINAKLPRRADGSIPLFSYSRGGVLINPEEALSNMTCSWPGDGGSMTRTNHGCGCQNDSSLIPNTTHTKCVEAQPCDNWCDPVGPGPFIKCHQCAWKESQLGQMLTLQSQASSQYNEVLVTASNWRAGLPHTIDAFFFPSNCGAPCRDEVTATHAQFLQKFAKTAAEVPLLSLDITSKLTPFSAA
jgi:hypothetical protein